MLAALVATLLAATLAGAPAAPPLGVELSPHEVTVGDRVEVTLSVDSAAGEPLFPDPGKHWGDVEVIEVRPAERASGGVTWRRRLTVAAFRTGEIELPSPVVRLPGGGEARAAAPIRLTVRSLLPKDAAEAKPRPATPPVALPGDPRFWWLVTLFAGLCLAGGGWLLDRERRRRIAARPERIVPPLEELLTALAALEKNVAPEPGHAGLSLALRRYLGRSLGFHAAESTTSEIQRELASRRLESGLVRRAVLLLRDCDGVKFARRDSTRHELDGRLAATREIAEAIERHLQPVPAVAEPRGAAA